MVALSKKSHADIAETSAPTAPAVSTLRAFYDSILPHLPRCRADAFDGGILLMPTGTPGHQYMAGLLLALLLPAARKHGWCAYPGLDVVLPGSRLPYTPDFAMAPEDAPRWGDREVFTDGLIMIGEIVSEGTANNDRNRKPGIYAKGGVPVMLLIDPLSDPPKATVYAGLRDGAYTTSSSVVLGAELHIPEPVDFTFDTALLLEE